MRAPTPSKSARLKAGLSLEAAARKFGIQPATLAQWERNQTRWAWTYRRALEGARFYGVSVNLFRRCHDPEEAAPKKEGARSRVKASSASNVSTGAIVSR